MGGESGCGKNMLGRAVGWGVGSVGRGAGPAVEGRCEGRQGIGFGGRVMAVGSGIRDIRISTFA